MQPIVLKMTAFGPYKDEETIDFRVLKDHRLFVISGPTGAGKTTIFDGILFALYGTASGEDRSDVKGLRSQFASDDVPTSVELLFSIGEKVYKIYRQLPYKKTGNKSETPGKVELYLVEHDIERPVVDQQKATEVAEKIKMLIGLTKEQFKQIVLLPQGEFQKLLTSDTENKEAILRKLFNTMKYGEIVEKLKEKRNRAQQLLEQSEARKRQLYQSIEEQIPKRQESALTSLFSEESFSTKHLLDRLEQEKQFYEATIESTAKSVEDMTVAYEAQLKQFSLAEEHNKRLLQYEALKTEYKNLCQQQAAIEEKRTMIEKMHHAKEINVLDERYWEVKHDYDQIILQSEERQAAKETVKRELVAVEALLEQAKIAQQQLPTIEAQLRTYTPLLPLFEQQETLQRQIEELMMQKRAYERDQQQITNQYDKRKQLVNDQMIQIKNMQLQLNRYPEVQRHFFEEQQKQQLLTQHRNWQQEFTTKQRNCALLEKEMQAQQKKYIDKRKDWLNNQAYTLAQELTDGQPCPVCGSKTHSVQLEEKPLISIEQLDDLKQIVERSERAYYEAKGDLTSSEEQQKTLVEEAKRLAISFDESPSEEKLQQLKMELQQLEQQKQQLEPLQVEVEKVERQLQNDEEQVKQYEQLLTTTDGHLREHQTLLAHLCEQLPKQFTTKQQLQQIVTSLEEKRQQITEQFATKQQQFTTKQQQYAVLENDCKHIANQLTKVTSALKEAETAFKQRVLQYFEDGQHYMRTKKQMPLLANYVSEVEQYEKERFALEKTLEASKELEQQEIMELEALEQQLSIQKEQRLMQIEQLNQLKTIDAYIMNSMKAIAQQQLQASALTKKAASIVHLYDLLRGQNAQKISFERYLQIEYLEQIIEAANIRLRKLSNGQFMLKRSERLEARGKQSGLGLDVYDAYTGLERDVKTMSGGEKFNASLCLALGISDVIQNNEGRIQIDTMFIDEGFGTLDEESLAKAIDTLAELQKSGRMIGVISHVSGLKEAIPAVLEVRKRNEGHSYTTFQLK